MKVVDSARARSCLHTPPEEHASSFKFLIAHIQNTAPPLTNIHPVLGILTPIKSVQRSHRVGHRSPPILLCMPFQRVLCTIAIKVLLSLYLVSGPSCVTYRMTCQSSERLDRRSLSPMSQCLIALLFMVLIVNGGMSFLPPSLNHL